jgi:hypothetical protein
MRPVPMNKFVFGILNREIWTMERIPEAMREAEIM